MNAMNMPGFTAEASIYKTSEDYQTAGIMVQFVADASSILPALACICPCEILICTPEGACQIRNCG